MTIDVIDPSMHLAAFPATYTGPGTVVGNTRQGGNEEELYGYFTSTGNATQINLGFRPNNIKVVNETDVIIWEWNYGLAATHTVKTVTGGTTTIDATSAIVPLEPAGSNTGGNWIVTLSAALCSTAKNITFSVLG